MLLSMKKDRLQLPRHKSWVKAKIDSISAIYEIAGAIGLGFTAQQSILFFYKFIPFWGSITSIFTVFCATYVIGKTMDFLGSF